jgi:alkylhydroperoxidase family enzyme
VEAKDIMKARIDLMHVTPGVIQAMLGLERQVRQAGFDHQLLDLVRMRASQINGCSYCLAPFVSPFVVSKRLLRVTSEPLIR